MSSQISVELLLCRAASLLEFAQEDLEAGNAGAATQKTVQAIGILNVIAIHQMISSGEMSARSEYAKQAANLAWNIKRKFDVDWRLKE